MTKLSRSKLELLTECPRCFWLDVKHGIKRPQPAPYTINNAIDYLLKQEFDLHREKGMPHPVMQKHNIHAIPYKAGELHKWRHNFTGIQYHHKPTDFLVYGAVDDVWVNAKKELIVVDYKATGAREHHIYDSYKRQLEIYQWLLRQNGFPVSPTGYFVFARVNKASGFGNGEATLPFDLFIEAQEGNDAWIPGALDNAREVINSDDPPKQSEECQYCFYRAMAGEIA